jgi:ribosomal protein S18 acetylase RimI-like enzyme
MPLNIRLITENKKDFLDLLLLADEQEDMIDRYLDRGDLFALYDDGRLTSICVVTDEGDGVFEIQNLATYPQYQRQGYAKQLVSYVSTYYNSTSYGGHHCQTLLVGTGDTPLTVSFYEHCGFTFSHRVPNYFLEHYDHPIIEDGAQLIDKVYFRKEYCDTDSGLTAPSSQA